MIQHKLPRFKKNCQEFKNYERNLREMMRWKEAFMPLIVLLKRGHHFHKAIFFIPKGVAS
jgi:hypothetical protein